MPTYAALLRGVNVGGKAKVPMAQLRSVIEALGYTNVSTYIQSGNVVFTSSKAVTPKAIEAAVAKGFGIDVAVVLRTAAQLKKVVKDNPFAKADTSKVHVGFMASKPTGATLKKIDVERFLPEEFAVRGSDLYLHLPNGMGRSKLPAYLDQQLKIPTTVRNWNTVTKLIELTTTR